MKLPTCQEVSTAVARGNYEEASFLTRLRMQIHLAICWHCRRFKRQINLIRQAFQKSVFTPPESHQISALEQSILKRVLSSGQ